jgi:hypothetical protein
MFRALLTDPQEALHKRHLVYCSETTVGILQFHCTIPTVVCDAPPEDQQVMLETCRGL